VPGEMRTPAPQIRSPVFYLAELAVPVTDERYAQSPGGMDT